MGGKASAFRKNARAALDDAYSRIFLSLLSGGFAILRRSAMSAFGDADAAMARARAIRAYAVENLPELLEEFERNAARRGTRVLWARSGREACDMVASIAKERRVSLVAKGKSMVTEEIGLNGHLARNGVTSLETDLGEVITQVMGLRPFHIVGPAINVEPQRIAGAFVDAGIIESPTTDAVVLGKAVRAYLRGRFQRLEMGVVGVNMAVASTGTIVNVENEGNIRMIKSSPRTVVAVMTPEKIVPTMPDAVHMLKILSRNCTGQKLAGCVTLDTGPRAPSEKDGPEELYVIVVDAGRSEIYKDPLTRQVLRCIRCGACLNTCPVYTHIGGYPYGRVYSGPMGVVLSPLLDGYPETSDLYRACTLCRACREVCPAGVDHVSLILAYRARETALRPWGGRVSEGALLGAACLLATTPFAWRVAVRLARSVLGRAAPSGYIRDLPGALKGWTQCRDLPAVAPCTFHEWWRKRGGASETNMGEECG